MSAYANVLFERIGSKYTVRFSYNPRAVELVKMIPSWGRSYDPSSKTWTVDRQFAEGLARDFTGIGMTVGGLEAERERARKAPPPPPLPLARAREGWAEELLRRCSPELRRAVVRNLAKALHTDLGGDGTLMQELNDARDAIEKKERAAG